MRVISGTARGTKLNSIEDISTRPTLDRVKESLFNIISNKIDEDCVALDLFAGSGAIGIELLSRRAKKVFLSDISDKAIKVIQQNLEKTHLRDKAVVINKDYNETLNILYKEKFDIIFIDPPYKMDIAVSSIKKIEKLELLKKDGIIIIETDEAIRDENEINELITNYKIYDVRKYGRATLIFLNWKE